MFISDNENNQRGLMVQVVALRDGTFRASCPSLPGCFVHAASQCEVEIRIQQAICGYLDHLDIALPRELAKCCYQERKDRKAARAARPIDRRPAQANPG
jgi:predicted RNase H-like HicB family nuclease